VAFTFGATLQSTQWHCQSPSFVMQGWALSSFNAARQLRLPCLWCISCCAVAVLWQSGSDLKGWFQPRVLDGCYDAADTWGTSAVMTWRHLRSHAHTLALQNRTRRGSCSALLCMNIRQDWFDESRVGLMVSLWMYRVGLFLLSPGWVCCVLHIDPSLAPWSLVG
jgi:hypothetical protein